MKLRQFSNSILVAFLVLAFGVPASQASPLALSDTPLIVSTSVEPNVMLLIDNSGSMEEIIWDVSFNPATTYERWAYRSGSNWFWINSGTIYRPSNFAQGLCTTGYKHFWHPGSGTFKCIRIPDPLSSGTRYRGNYANFIAENFANNDDLTQGQIPNDYRMNVARDVSREIVNNTPGMRFGISSFNFNEGATVNASCGAPLATTTSVIDGLIASTWTPLAESLYEITRYFRGMSSFYNTGTNYTSPIQYRCQKNFTIVVTDGLPTYDTNFPSDDPDDIADLTRSLPNWDNLAPTTTAAMSPVFPQYSDGFQPQNNLSWEAYTLYLDDIAKFAWDIDFKKTGLDNAGVSYQDPAFSQQNMYTYTVGFAVDNQMLLDAAEYGQGVYYTADTADQLRAVLQAALKDILGKLGSSASAAANAGFVGTDTKVYQARFNSTDWSGELLAFEVGPPTIKDANNQDIPNPNYGRPSPTPAWDAGSKIPAWDSRVILTTLNGVGESFEWASFSDIEKGNYFGGTTKEPLLEWIRGRDVLGYRPRATVLGDIVNSAPAFVGPPAFRYPDALESASYGAFKANNANRDPMLYVGSNSGKLHGFKADKAANETLPGVDLGVEKLAYIPSILLPHLQELAEGDYQNNHRFFVDGSPTVVDAYFSGAWHTVLVGGLNKGGQAIYALDVTDPANFTEANASNIVLWEFTDTDDADLGFTYSQPAIVRLANGRWAAVFGNGYNNTLSDGFASSTGNAALYVIDLEDGSLIKKIDTNTGTAQDPTGAGRPNGLATVRPVDLNDNFTVDYVYAGDLFGNLWKFDLSSIDPNNWGLGYNLFTACSANACSATNHQPITTRPSVVRHPTGEGQIVLFGTGKYLELADNNALAGGVQSFYGIWDRPAASAPAGRSQLLQQTILAENSFGFTTPSGSSQELRVTSNTTPDWNSVKGWYLDLVSPSGFQGERQVTNSVVRNDKVIFTTLIPTTDPCRPGGDSWLMELDVGSGGRLDYSPFDLDKDGKFTSADFVSVTINGITVLVPVSGLKLEGGAAATPSVIAAEDEKEFKYISTADGLETILENPGPDDTGRHGWWEIGR